MGQVNVTTKQVKVVSAGIGAGATIAMGVLGLTFSSVSSAQEPTPAEPTVTPATTGQTITTTIPPTEEPTSEATPSVTGPAPLPSEEQGLPG